MTLEKRTAMIAGASGLTGSQLVKFLCENENYEKVTIIVRNAISFSHPKLVTKVKNLNQVTKDDFVGVDDFFCCLGTTMKKAGSKEAFEQVDLIAPIQMGKFAQSQGAKHMLVISAMGANPESNVYYNRVKGTMEDKVSMLSLPHVSIFRPSLLTGNREEFRLGERFGEITMTLLKPAFLGPLKKYRSIEAKQVAFAMMKIALRTPSRTVAIYDSEAIAQIK
ncbi:NAD(P)H-binding protein [Paenisporosarcina sp. HGH0030]|uniref:NAD(P)H-binding protein n=1 Tax=Paenisporosarcina sp. HGH0030 TaxID=1078085 RepID=UPI0003A4EF0D|nr:NAD(P)H-binding protein [Paenisporosarcina sp. HGH0030]